MHFVRLTLIVTALSCWALGASAAEKLPDILIGTRPAEFIQTKITVSNLRKSYDFYTKVVGLKPIAIPGFPQPDIDDTEAAFSEVCLNYVGSLAESYFCVMKRKGVVPDRQQTKLVSLSFKTPDTRAVLERVKAFGMEPSGGPGEFRGLVIGVASDPDGYALQFVQAKSVTQ